MPVIGCGTQVFTAALDDIKTRFNVGHVTVAKRILCSVFKLYLNYFTQIDIYPDPLSDHQQIIRAVDRHTGEVYKVYVKELIPCKKGFHFQAYDWSIGRSLNTVDQLEQQVLCL